MRVGDLLEGPYSYRHLVVCINVNIQNGTFKIRHLTTKNGNVIPDSSPAMINDESIHNHHYIKILWGGPEYIGVINTQQLPAWVLSFKPHISATSSTPVNAPATPPTNANPISYPLGSLFIGTGRSRNVWIISKDNSDEISLLWDGKQGHYCVDENERRDRLATPRNPDDIKDVYAFIGATSIFPMWAINLHHNILTKNGKQLSIFPPGYSLKSKLPTPAPMSPAIMNWAKTQFKEEKRVDSPAPTCDHRFIFAKGFNRDYEYCTICDVKRDLKQ